MLSLRRRQAQTTQGPPEKSLNYCKMKGLNESCKRWKERGPIESERRQTIGFMEKKCHVDKELLISDEDKNAKKKKKNDLVNIVFSI